MFGFIVHTVFIEWSKHKSKMKVRRCKKIWTTIKIIIKTIADTIMIIIIIKKEEGKQNQE